MRILFIQLRRIGDVVTTTPAIRATRKTWPNAIIDYITEPPADQILENNPYLNNVILVKRGLNFSEFIEVVKMVRANRYDVVVDFFANPTSAYLSFLSGSKIRLGYNNRFRRHFYTHRVDRKLFGDNSYAGVHKLLLLAHIGVISDGFHSDYFLTEQQQAKADDTLRDIGWNGSDLLITLGVSVRQVYRRWPFEKFAYVADYLIETYGAKIAFVYGPGEEDMAIEVQSLMKNKALDLYEQGGLHLLRGIVERSTLHIANDSGATHAVKAAGVHNITIYARGSAKDWATPNVPRNIAVENYLQCRYQCLHDDCPDPICVNAISTDEVIAHCDDVMKELKFKKIK